MRKPLPVKNGCTGSYNADAEKQRHAKKRPFRHASKGRDNWKKSLRTSQRRATAKQHPTDASS